MGISLKELKKNRMTPAEKWVLEQIEGAKPKTYPSGNVDWYNKDMFLFKQKFNRGLLRVSLCNITSVLEDRFGLNDNQIEDLLANILYDYTNKGQLKIALL